MKKLAVIYRAVNLETGDLPKREFRPLFFDKKHCWKGFYREFNRPDTDIYVLFDAPKDNLDGELSNYIRSFSVKEFKFIHCCDNKNSLIECINLTEELKNNYEFFGHQECDYEFAKGTGEFTLDALNLGYHPITLYQHPDRNLRHPTTGLYTGYDDICHGKEMIGLTNYSYVRTCESTTCSFFFSSEWFSKWKDTYIKHIQEGIGAPNDRMFWRFLYLNGERLWSDVFGKSVHMDKRHISPFFKWCFD